MTCDPDRMKRSPEEDRFQEPLDCWLRDQKPPAGKPMGELAELRTTVKARVHTARRTRRRQVASRSVLVAAVLLLGVVVMDFQDLGSDGFELEQIEGSLSPTLLKNKFRGSVFNPPPGATEAENDEVSRIITGRLGTVKDIWGIQVDDEPVFWSITREAVLSSGKVHTYTSPPKGVPQDHSRELGMFMMKKVLPLHDTLKSGELASRTGRRTVRLDGMLFSCRTWEVTVEGRRVVYIEGLPQ